MGIYYNDFPNPKGLEEKFSNVNKQDIVREGVCMSMVVTQDADGNCVLRSILDYSGFAIPVPPNGKIKQMIYYEDVVEGDFRDKERLELIKIVNP